MSKPKPDSTWIRSGWSRRKKPRRPVLNGLVFLFLGASGLWGCSSTDLSATSVSPDFDAGPLVEHAQSETMPDGPVQIAFDFRYREADLRFSGQGVARVQPPYRVRIDLFTNGGESLFRAALVESDLRVPPGVPIELAPPPALLWAALGVFRPDAGLSLLGGRPLGEDDISARYSGNEGEDLRFRFSDGRLSRAEIHRDGHLIEEVDLELDPSTGDVTETVYRNRALFVELTFSLKSLEHVESFPPQIWFPGG